LDEVWIEHLLGLAMFTLMFGMGLALTTTDFRRIAKNPRATILGTVLQLVVMPAIGIAIAHAFGLPAILAAGIVVVAAAPGGMFSNMFVHLARGHTALSITLTATATLVTLFTLPLWLRFAMASFSAEGTQPIEMPVIATALRLGTLTVLPVAVGMLVRRRWPSAVTYERRLSTTGAIAIGIAVFLQGSQRPELPIEAFLESLLPALAFAIAAIVVGVTMPILFRIPARDAVTIAVELIVKNTLLGIVLVGQVLEFEAALPIFAFSIFQTPGGILLLAGWRLLEKHGAIATSVEAT